MKQALVVLLLVGCFASTDPSVISWLRAGGAEVIP